MKYLSRVSAIILTSILAGFSTQAQNFIYAKGLKNPTLLGGNVENSFIAMDHQDNVYVLGKFSGIADFDPGPDSANLKSEGKEDIFFAKYDKFGTYIYAKRIGGTESDVAEGIAVDSTGNVYIIGNFQGPLDFDPGTDTAYMIGHIIAKYDPFGNYIFSKAIGTSANNHILSIALDAQQNFFITGSFHGPVDFDPGNGEAIVAGSGLYQDIYFAKYDSSGNYVYAKALAGPTLHVGHAIDIAVSKTGNVFITGGFTGTIDFDPGSGIHNVTVGGSRDDIFLAGYDSNGNYRYAERFFGDDFDQPADLTVDEKDNSYITGTFFYTIDFDPVNSGGSVTSFGPLSDIFVAKHDSLGNFVYAKSFGGSNGDGGRGITVDSLSNVYITGNFFGTVEFDAGNSSATLTSAGGDDIFILKLDPAGQYVYVKSIGGTANDEGISIIVDINGGVHVAGSFSGTVDFDPGVDTALLSINGTGTNGFIVNLTNTGEYQLAIQQGKYSNIGMYDQASQIAVDSIGNIYITGGFYGTVDFDPGNDTAYLTSAGASDIFVAKYDASGNYVYAFAVGGTNTDRGVSIAIDPSSDVYISGSFRGTVDLNPGVDTATHTSAGHVGVFIARYDNLGNYIYSKSIVGSDDIDSYGLQVDDLGNLFITGSFLGTADFDPGANVMNLTSAGSRDIFVARYDHSGNYVYAKRIGGPNWDFARSIVIDEMASVYITGYFEGTVDFDPGVNNANLTSAGGTDIFLASYDASGNFLNAKRFGGTLNDQGTGIVLNSSGNLYLSGGFSGTVDFDAGPGSALITGGGNFIAIYDKQGNYLLAKSFTGSDNSSSRGIATDDQNNVFIVGSFFGTIDCDPDINTANHTSAGAEDIFIVKYDGNLNYVFSKAMGGIATDYGNSITPDRSGNIYVVGSFQNTAEFNRGFSSANSVLSSDNADDIFFAKYGPTAGLPVQLLSFYVKTSLNNDAVEVSWRTTSEDNNDYFEVERSKDGVRFEVVGRVEGCITCRFVNEYAFSDRDPYVGISYYRLRQVDNDKGVSFSRIQKVYFEEKSKSEINIYPSITNGDFTLVINNHKEARNVVVQIFSQTGSLMQKTTSWITKGNSAFEYNISALSKGIYFISLTETNGTRIFTSKIFKK